MNKSVIQWYSWNITTPETSRTAWTIAQNLQVRGWGVVYSLRCILNSLRTFFNSSQEKLDYPYGRLATTGYIWLGRLIVYTQFTTEEAYWWPLFPSGFHSNIPALWKLATKAESFQFSFCLISLSPTTKACATFDNRTLLCSFHEDTLVSMSVLFQESKVSLKSTTYMEVAYWLALEFSFNNFMVSGATLSTHAVYFCLNSFKKYFYIVP